MQAADKIRDQLVRGMRFELDQCPDPIDSVLELEDQDVETEVDWDNAIHDGLRLKTGRGTFEVRISVQKVE